MMLSFYFPNKGSDAQEIHKVVSGGELSRLMLCFSYLTSNYENLSCLIFDEIDTGVSGESRSNVGDDERYKSI